MPCLDKNNPMTWAQLFECRLACVILIYPTLQFDMFLGVVHGVTRRNKGNEKAAKASAAEHEAAVARAKEHREQKEGSLLSAPVLPAEQTAAPSIDLAPPADKEAEIAKRPTSTAAA
eukprot:1149626-Pelagomonas_calceolata.AAC.9